MVNQRVVDYIKTSLAQGKTKEEIYKEFLKQGWTIKVIEKHFNAIDAKQEEKDTSKRTIYLVVTIGAILVGAGIFSFIAANWQEMSKPVKVGVILVSMLTSYGIGWYLKEKLNLEKTGSALFLLGSIIYGAGIFLVAQIFHTRVSWPDGFILWMFGVIAVAFALESFLHFYFAILLGGMAMFGYPLGIFIEIFNYRSFLLTSPFLLLLATAATFITGLAIKKRMPPEVKRFF